MPSSRLDNIHHLNIRMESLVAQRAQYNSRALENHAEYLQHVQKCGYPDFQNEDPSGTCSGDAQGALY